MNQAAESGKYDDIIHLSRPVSGRHAPMSMIDRAAQFSPFAALTGYDGVIRETARETDVRTELTETAKAELNEKLQMIAEVIDTQPEVTVVHFCADQRKSGGSYLITAGKVKKIDLYEQVLMLQDGSRIPIHQIYQIDSPML